MVDRCTKIPLVLTDGEIEQLQAGDLVTVVIGDLDGDIAGVSVSGNTKALQVNDQRLLVIVSDMLGEMRRMRKHLQAITGEEWDDDDDSDS